MGFKLNLQKSIIFGLILAAIALVIGYIIFARNRVNNELISIPAILGFTQGFFKDLGNSMRKEYLVNVRLKLIISGIIGFAVGFIGGSIKFK